MLLLLAVVNLSLCVSISIGLATGREPSAGSLQLKEGSDPAFAAANVKNTKAEAETLLDKKSTIGSEYTLNEYTTVYCDKRKKFADAGSCQVAFAQASNNTDVSEIDSLVWGNEAHWRYRKCGIATPTFDDVSKSNVTWNNVMDAVGGIITKCKANDRVGGSATIMHENGLFDVTILNLAPSGQKSDFTGSLWSKYGNRMKRPSRRLR